MSEYKPTEDDLAIELEKNYKNAEKREKVYSVIMFGITHWQTISEGKLSPDKIVDKANLSENGSYATELRKGIKIGKKLSNMHFFSQKTPLMQSKIKSTKLNQILYGPPGTGKTYHTIDKALEILGIDCKDKTREEKKELFEAYKKEGQIEFVTFHQSYSYEEFVEGIKPDEKEGAITYKTKSGIFKKLCEKAEQNFKEANPDKYREEIQLEELVNLYLNHIREQLDSVDETNDNDTKEESLKLDEDIRILGINANNGLIVQNTKRKDPQTISTSKSSILYRDYSNFINGKITQKEEMEPSENSKNKFHGNAEYYFAFYKALKKFSQSSEIAKSIQIERQPFKPYILIIDEINRGNISKIFGELITLIEPSKRLGENEELRVVLPYSGSSAEEDESKELFGVPSNLYIIGTMNTADRSITSIDTALRRRFEFEEMMPDPSKLKDNMEGINLIKMLEAINERIEYLCGREKTIGHAYLIEVDSLQSLKNAFQNKIIPLLQEYFHNDYEAIGAVLNDNGMIRNNQDFKYTQGSFKTFTDNRGMNEKKIFRIATEIDKNKGSDKCVWEDTDTYIAIYDDKVSKELK